MAPSIPLSWIPNQAPFSPVSCRPPPARLSFSALTPAATGSLDGLRADGLALHEVGALHGHGGREGLRPHEEGRHEEGGLHGCWRRGILWVQANAGLGGARAGGKGVSRDGCGVGQGRNGLETGTGGFGRGWGSSLWPPGASGTAPRERPKALTCWPPTGPQGQLHGKTGESSASACSNASLPNTRTDLRRVPAAAARSRRKGGGRAMSIRGAWGALASVQGSKGKRQERCVWGRKVYCSWPSVEAKIQLPLVAMIRGGRGSDSVHGRRERLRPRDPVNCARLGPGFDRDRLHSIDFVGFWMDNCVGYVRGVSAVVEQLGSSATP